jgi:hemolysin activation/secretion protein
LALTVVPKDRLDFYLTAGNSRSPSIGGERVAAGGSIRNLFTSGDIVTAEAGLTEGKGDAFGSYELPLKDAVTSFRLRGGYNEAAVVDRPLRPLDIGARDWNGELSLNRRLLQRPLMPAGDPGRWTAARTIAVGLAVAHRRTVTTLLGRRFSFSPGSVNGRAEYTALRLTADFVQRGINQVLALSLTGTQGIGGTIGDVPGLLTPDPNFRALLGQFSLARRLNRKGLELRLRLSGQAADGILYSGERIAAGGEHSVRGYRETLVLADTGLIGSAEIAQSFSLTGGQRGTSGADWGAFQASIFADGALLHNRGGPKPVPDELASIGTSLAWTPSEAIFARVSYAKALKEAPLVGTRDLQDRGFQFRVTIRPFALLGQAGSRRQSGS